MGDEAKLSLKEQQNLISLAQAHHDAAMNQLIEMHMPLVYALANRFSPCTNCRDELVQSGVLGLIQAIQHYDLTSNTKLITYAFSWIMGEMRAALRTIERSKEVSIDQWENGEESIYDCEAIQSLESLHLSHMDLRQALMQLNKDARLLIYLRFYREKTQKETAVILRKSQSQISKLERRTLEELKFWLN